MSIALGRIPNLGVLGPPGGARRGADPVHQQRELAVLLVEGHDPEIGVSALLEGRDEGPGGQIGVHLEHPAARLAPLVFVIQGLLSRLLERLETRHLACAALSLTLELEGGGRDARRVGVAAPTLDLRGLVRARRLSRATMRNIRQNLFFAFVYNSLGVPIAAGVLYPFFGILLSPIIAAAAMSFSSVSVIGNALRLNRAKL